jgi:hypothetical protein
LVQNLQKYIKENENSPWAVSLRDVSRFCHFLVYFNENSISEDSGVYWENKERQKKSKNFHRREIAIVLAIYFCYIIRMPSTT